MAGFRKIYTSQNEYLEDIARNSEWFDEDYYEEMVAQNKGADYINVFATTRNNVKESFNPTIYHTLSGADKYTYFVAENLLDHNSDEYKQTNDYINQKLEAIKRQETYEGLNGFEKTIYSIGGIIGNAFLQIGGIVEGLIDVGALGAGAIGGAFGADTDWAKEFVAEDTTGYAAAQQAMNEWMNEYTFLDKNVVWRGANDVVSGIVRMVPLIAGTALAPYTGGVSAKIGSTIYFGSMAGNVAEEAVVANPDINFGSLLAYTGLVTGVEYAVEKVSGKIFGDDIVSAAIKGKAYRPTGSISKTIFKNIVSEGLEEGTAEIFDTLLYNVLVDNTKSLTWNDIIYASIIGGITGGIMSGGHVLSTRSKSVHNGELVYTNTLSKEQRKEARNLGKTGTYVLNNLLANVQTSLASPTAVTDLMTKHGLSLKDTKVQYRDEYREAVKADKETQTKQAKMVLQLANLLQTIGVEQFQRSAKFLNEQLAEATELINNYINHTDAYNKLASAAYSTVFKGQSYTPSAQTTNSEQQLTKALREIYPDLKVSFGTMGSKDGRSVRSIAGTKGWLFIKSGLVDKIGFETVLHQTIRQELAKSTQEFISRLSSNLTDPLVKLVLDDENVKYKDLSEEQKLTIAQIVCFDPVHNRRIFLGQKESHEKLYKFITDQVDYVKNFARKTEANKVRYHDLLKIRDTFINSVAQSIDNVQDVAKAQERYKLSDEETRIKIIDKTRTTTLNEITAIMDLNFSKDAILTRESIEELLNNRRDTKAEFDFDRIFDKDYYSEDFVNTITSQQRTKNFEKALKQHLLASYQVALDNRAQIVQIIADSLSDGDVDKAAQILLTPEFVKNNQSKNLLRTEVAATLYTMLSREIDESADSVVIEDGQLKGTGKLKYLKVKTDERNNIYNDQQSRGLSESTGEQVGNVVTKSTTIANKVTINQIDESSYNDRQKEMVVYARKEYLVNLHFYEGSAILDGYDKSVDYGLNGFIYGEDDVYIRYDDTLNESDIEKILLHEGTHRLIAARKSEYEILRDKIISLWKTDTTWESLKAEYSSDDMYGKIYDNESDIEEEIIVDLCCGRIAAREYVNGFDVIEAIFDFYNEVSLTMVAKEKGMFPNNEKILRQHETRDSIPSHIMTNETATWTQERLDALIKRNTSPSNPNIVYAYAAYINPHDFVAVTTNNARERSTLRRQMRDYAQEGVALEDMKTNTETPFLHIDPITMEILGHEGRHRMWSMYEAGITEAPVVLFVDDSDVASIQFSNNTEVSNKIYKNVSFKGQADYFGTRRNDSKTFVVFRDMIPLNESHRKLLEKTFVTGWSSGGPKFRFAKDLKQQNKQETSMQQKINKAESPKQIADVITAIIEAAPLEMSETKGYGDEGTRMYKKTSDEMRRKYASLWTKITQENYDKVRNELVKSDYEYADEALLIFDRFTRAYAGNSTKFDEATKKKIMEVGSRKQTIAAISQGLQSAELANEHSFGETAAAFEKDGYKVTVSNDTVKEYVPEMANKKEFIKELDKEISNIEEQIKTAETDIDAAELNNQLDKAVEKRIVMSEGTNEEIMDWVIKNEDVVTKASKLQKEVFEQMVNKGELAQKEGKKAVTILVDEKTGLPKPFPKATQFIEKNVKRLKSFRMWSMLASPVSWVRNWVGNAGMTALDSLTNSLEKFITSKQKVMSQQELAKLEKQHHELSRKEKLTDTEKSKLAQLSNQIARNYDFKFVETKASKDLRKQIAEDYKDVIQQILNGEDVKYESSAEKAAAITRAERKITRASQNANLGQKLWAACQSITDWGLNTGWFGDNAVVVNSLVKNFANMVESNKTYLIKSLTTEYGKDGRGMSAERKALVEKALKTKDSMDIVNAMSKYDVDLFMDSCKQRTFEQYFKNQNWLSTWASNLSKKHPIAASLTSLVLPFPKVAANILSMAYKYSPLGFLSAARQWSVVKQMDAAGYEGVRDAFARAKAGRTTAQATVGSFMMLAGLILAAVGVVDIDEDDYMGPSLNVGNVRISLANLAPSMTTFSVGSAMMWAWKNDQSATLKALDVLYDNTLLGNIENVFRYGDPSKYIENLSINYFSQYVPAVLKLFAKFTTNQEMIDKSGSYFAKLGKTFASGIPGVANLLPKKINPYTGETLTGTGTSNVFFNFIEALSPLDMRYNTKSATQKEAERLQTTSTGLSGKFSVNDKEYVVDKVTYSKYRANYIQTQFEQILSGKQKVTVEDDSGKRITTTYEKLNDKQKKNVINRLYTEATSMTKIKWWTDQGNTYVVTDKDTYNEYRKMFNNIIYRKNWSKSKFVES